MAKRYFRCETDKAPHTYLVGETVTFRLSYRCDGEKAEAPSFRFKILGDAGYEREGVISGESREIIISESFRAPGFLYLEVEALSASGEPIPDSTVFRGGAGAEIGKIHLETKEPQGYRRFWECCRAELYAVDPTVIKIERLDPDPEHPDHDAYDLTIAAPGGIPVSGILTLPRQKGRYPARVSYHSYGVRSAIAEYSGDEIVLNINAHGLPNRRPKSYYDELRAGRLAGYGFDKEQNLSPHTCYFKYVMLRAAQALRYLMTRPEWDGKTLTAKGGSQGAVQALHAARLVPEVSLVDIWVPWLCDINAETAGRRTGWGDRTEDAVLYFDSALCAAFVTQRTRVLAGLGDTTSPPAGVVAMVKNLGGEHSLTLVQGREHGSASPEAVAFEVDGI